VYFESIYLFQDVSSSDFLSKKLYRELTSKLKFLFSILILLIAIVKLTRIDRIY